MTRRPMTQRIRAAAARPLMPPLWAHRAVLATALAVAAFLAAALPAPAHAQSFVRDSEIEHTIRGYSDPIFRAAGLVPENVRIFLINDRNINAFVAGGQNMFVNTGTIMQLERPRQLIGIIAHETGHITGGHLARTSDAASAATVPLLIGTLLGIAAAASGNPDAGMGILLGGQEIAQRSFLAFTRTQESAADQAAIDLLNATGQSGRGLLETFELFAGQEVLSERRQDPYVRTHPMSRERLAALSERVTASPYSDLEETAEQRTSYARMQAKLIGFLERGDVVLRRFPESDQSINARYARAIAHYRVPDVERAVAVIDTLIADEPANPFFHELKGQVLFENGRVADAVEPHAQSVRLMPSEPLFKVAYGQALIATEKADNVRMAVEVLERALDQDEDSPATWYHLAQGYGRLGDVGMAEYATAERHFRTGNVPQSLRHAQRALCELPKGSIAERRTRDIIETVKSHIELEKKDDAERARTALFGPDGKGPPCPDRGGSGARG